MKAHIRPDLGKRMPASLEDRLPIRRVNNLAIAWCINTLAYSITYPFLPIYLHGIRGFPMSQVGTMYLVMGLSRVLAPPICGPWTDRYGRRFGLIYASAFRGAVFFLMALLVATEASFLALAITMFLTSFLGAFFQISSDSYVTDITPPRFRAEAFSRIRVGLNLGWMTGPAIGGFLSQTPFSLLFAITGALCLVTVLVTIRYCPEPERIPFEGALAGSPTGMTDILFRDPSFGRMLACAFLLLVVSSQLVSTLSIYAREQIGMSGNQIGLLYTLNGMLVILLQVLISRAIGRVNLAIRMLIGSLFYAAGYFSLAFAVRPAHAFLSVGIFTFGEMLALPAFVSAVSRQASPHLVGRYMGLYGLIWGLAYSIGPYMGSLLYAVYSGMPVRFWGTIVVAALAAAVGFSRLTRLPAMNVSES